MGPGFCALSLLTHNRVARRVYEAEDTPLSLPPRPCSRPPTFSAAPGRAQEGQLLTQVPVGDRRLVALTTAPGHVLV